MIETPETLRGTLGAGSHIATLTQALLSTWSCMRGKVLELGMGWWSTPLLHGLCEWGAEELVSVDDDPAWAEALGAIYKRSWHHFSVSPDIRDLHYHHWALAFVDSSPGDKRVDTILALKDRVSVFVAHDVETDIPPSAGAYGWKRLEGAFKYEYINKDLRPWTAVWSDTVDVTKFFGKAC